MAEEVAKTIANSSEPERQLPSQAGYNPQRYNRVVPDHCGEQTDQNPKVGVAWMDFVSCQRPEFTLLGKEHSVSGVTSVYINDSQSLEIHVVNGHIVHWTVPKYRRSSGTSLH